MASRKIWLLLFLACVLSGCATYKFQKSTGSNAQGFVACYDNKPILEYTVGKEKSLPDLALAKERFKRRRLSVEYYCKKMNQIESRLKVFFWEPPAMAVGFLSGVLRWPFIAVADYKYNHSPEYKARVDKLDEEREALEAARIGSLRKKLDAYVAEDLSKESLPPGAAGVVVSAPKSQPEVSPVAPKLLLPASALPAAQEVMPTATSEPSTLSVAPKAVAVITAQPLRGYSPLKVNFSGQKSYSKSGKIVAYLWDFGDGDTSTKKNPENTYWSATFGSRNFTVTLTVKDQAGSVSSATATVEVITR